MPDEQGPAPQEIEEEKSEATLDEDDLESEEEQTWEDEYEDMEGQSTAPKHHGPGITVERYRCGTCGHLAERRATGTAYDELPPVHHNKYMLAVSEEEAKLPLEEMLERVKARAARRTSRAKVHTPKRPAKKKARPKAKPARKARPARKKAARAKPKKRRR